MATADLCYGVESKLGRRRSSVLVNMPPPACRSSSGETAPGGRLLVDLRVLHLPAYGCSLLQYILVLLEVHNQRPCSRIREVVAEDEGSPGLGHSYPLPIRVVY